MDKENILLFKDHYLQKLLRKNNTQESERFERGYDYV